MTQTNFWEIRAIRAALNGDTNPDPDSWKYYCHVLLGALDELCDILEPVKEWI